MKKLYLIGGRPCSGKTTLAYQLAKKHDIAVKHLDVFAHNAIEASTTETPQLYRWKGYPFFEVLDKKPDILCEEYLDFYDELFPMLLKEIASYEEEAIIMEGSILLPKYLGKLNEAFDVKIVYLKTTDEFVKNEYIKRDYAIDLANQPGGQRILTNLLARDSLFAQHLENEVQKNESTQFSIGDNQDFEHVMQAVETLFELKNLI